MTSFFEFQFLLFSVLAIVSALLFVTRRNPVPAALWLVNVMFALSGLYVMLDAPNAIFNSTVTAISTLTISSRY